MDEKKGVRIALLMALGLMLSVFIFSLFKNIQYPLLWNDEAETAMYAKRILQYGYPKIQDGKNIVWLSELADKSLGINKKADSCSALVWGQYYFAAIGEFFAEMTGDIYKKTALMRIPFASIGLAGLFIMVLSISGLFEKKKFQELLFFNIFFFFAIISIPLTLHLREARHPAIVIFLSACIFCAYFYYRYYGKIKFLPYFIALTILLFLLYNVFHMACFVFLVAIGLYEAVELKKDGNINGFLRNVAPLIATFILVIPFFILCRMFEFGKAYSVLCQTKSAHYWHGQTTNLFSVFLKCELIYPVLAAKIVLFYVFLYFSKRRLPVDPSVINKMRVSNFLSFFAVIYGLITAFFPCSFIFERYYIVLCPVLIIILLLDVFVTFELFSQVRRISTKRWCGSVYAVILLLVLSVNAHDMIGRIRGHAYELFNQYEGPLDLAIPFIKSYFKNPENLVIATNYEELDYMYYLGSRTIVGFVGNNLEEDSKMRPDIIIFRQRPSFVDPAVFDRFIRRDKYTLFLFPIYDYFVNNIPETEFHLYKTRFCNYGKKCFGIMIRSDHINNAS